MHPRQEWERHLEMVPVDNDQRNETVHQDVTSGDVCPDLGRVPVDTSADDVHNGADPKEERD